MTEKHHESSAFNHGMIIGAHAARILEREIVKLFFGIGLTHGLTLEEIGSKFELTRERVRQIKEKAIRRLKHTSRSKILKTYLG